MTSLAIAPLASQATRGRHKRYWPAPIGPVGAIRLEVNNPGHNWNSVSNQAYQRAANVIPELFLLTKLVPDKGVLEEPNNVDEPKEGQHEETT